MLKAINLQTIDLHHTKIIHRDSYIQQNLQNICKNKFSYVSLMYRNHLITLHCVMTRVVPSDIEDEEIIFGKEMISILVSIKK